MKEKFISFFKRETVPCTTFAFAAASKFPVHLDEEYPGYMGFRPLAILFFLMGVMSGL